LEGLTFYQQMTSGGGGIFKKAENLQSKKENKERKQKN
jgi:hypothetical protein